MHKRLIALLTLSVLLALLLPMAYAQDTATPEPVETESATVEPTEMATQDSTQEGDTTPEGDDEMADEMSSDMDDEVEVVPDAGFVRFAHFAPDAGTVDLTVNGETSRVTGLEYPAISDWIALAPGTATLALNGSDLGLGSMDFTVNTDQWTTVFVVPTTDGGVTTSTLLEDFNPDDLLPGTARITFVNALGNDQLVNFSQDDVPQFTELGSVGAEDDVNITSSLPYDAGTFSFSVSATESGNVLDQMADVKINDTSYYLFAVVGGDDPHLVVDETTAAEVDILEGDLEAPGTIIQSAQANDQLAPFYEAVEIAGLTEQLSGEGSFTIFAPIDFAMDDVLEQYRNDPATLEQILLNHVVEGDLKSSDVFDSASLTTLGGETLTIEQTEQGFVNGQQIVQVNVPATNGTIHIINGVLLPADLQQ